MDDVLMKKCESAIKRDDMKELSRLVRQVSDERDRYKARCKELEDAANKFNDAVVDFELAIPSKQWDKLEKTASHEWALVQVLGNRLDNVVNKSTLSSKQD